MSEVNSSVKFSSPERDAWLSNTLLSRSLFSGSEAMRSQGELFLPRGASESDTEYKQRKDDSFLIPAYRKVVQLLAGQAFKTDVIIDAADGVFEEIVKQPSINDDSITNFCKKSFERDLVDGCNHILVDAPVDGGRPFFRSISPESISAAVYDQGKLVCLKIDEKFEEKDGRFSSKQLNQWRVFELEYTESVDEDGIITYSYGQCKWEVWRESGSTEELFDSGYIDIDYIPIALFSGVVYGEPLLSDLADLCEAHWQSNSKQTYIMSAARTPILFTKNLEFENEVDADGNEKPTFRASSRRFLIGGDDSDAKWVEIQGGSIDAGFKHLEKIENAMESYGVNLFYRPEQTATAKGIDSAAAYSTLESWALIKQTQVQTAFEIAGDLLGVPFPEDAVHVQREYLGWAQSAEVRAMLAMLLSGNAISPETVFNAAKRYVQPIENEDWKDESKRIEKKQQAEGQGGS